MAVTVAAALWVWRRWSVRRAVQLCFAGLLAALLWLTSTAGRPTWPVDLFLLADPLVATVHGLVTGAVLPLMGLSLIVVVLTLLLGRVFCSHVCPLGTLLDVTDRVIAKAPTAADNRQRHRSWRQAKLVVLVAVLVAAVGGFNLLGFVDPLALVTRFAVTLFVPGVTEVAGLGARLIAPLAGPLDQPELAYLEPTVPAFEGMAAMIVVLGAILALSRLSPRFWCRHLCPLGGLLAWLGRWAPHRRRVDSTCTGCNRCVAACPVGAIHDQGRGTDRSECTACQTCVSTCPEGAVAFRFGAADPAQDRRGVGLTRRAWLGGAAGGFAMGLTFKVIRSHKADEQREYETRDRLIRPPGALPEPQFLSRCLGCGQCMQVCPTNAIQPDWYRGGLEGLWAPHLTLRHGHCDQSCNACGQVCPTEAIRPLQLDERRHARVGTAVLDRDRCLPWAQDQRCLVCREQCPYQAIDFIRTRHKPAPLPVVDPTRCNGCGICEDRCPVDGEAAIVVVPAGELRLASGSYRKTSRALGYRLQTRDRLELPFGVEDRPRGLPPR